MLDEEEEESDDDDYELNPEFETNIWLIVRPSIPLELIPFFTEFSV
jgi:hypothetical protein